MTYTRAGRVLAILIAVIYIIVSVSAVLYDFIDLPLLIVRLLALNGFLSLCFAAILTPFLREVRDLFGRPFLALHHTFAAVGIATITLHPVSLAIAFLDPSVFIIPTSSLTLFLALGGRAALPLIYVAFFAVLLRSRIPKYWRVFHPLMYLAILLGLIHGNMIGTDFSFPVVFFTLNTLGILALLALPLRRWRRWQAAGTRALQG